MATTPTLEHSQNTFIWRFVIFNPTDSRVVHVEASTEREARNCARPAVLLYSLPVFVRG
ncbi:host cell division inhibitor Icd-like protein [Escherichia coli]|uniref:host cell division inhibitor Icd-like protein n=1 Tax=Escherichia coli TaxID=562 RepID=UPI003974B739